MKVLLAFDKFRGCLSAKQACGIAADTLAQRFPGWSFDLCPICDGGEGFADILGSLLGARKTACPSCDPLGRPITGHFHLLPFGKLPEAAKRHLGMADLGDSAPIALIEMAACTGLTLLAPEERNPLNSSSFGTGQVMHAALEAGAQMLLLGIGGSASNDLGLGALTALGLQSTWSGQVPASPAPRHWERLVDLQRPESLRRIPVRVCCDVDNPLLGPNGATRIFGPQKGLKPEDLEPLEEAMGKLAGLLCRAAGQPVTLKDCPGAGAAGGIAFGLLCCCQSRLIPGSAFIQSCLELERRCAEADLVITGEGCFDQSSLQGKGPGFVLQLARRLGKPVHVFAGSLNLDLQTDGANCTAITPAGLPLDQALARAPEFLRNSLSQANFSL